MENPEAVSTIVPVLETIIWPLIVLILGLVFFIMFRSQIKVFISKVKSVSRDGVTTEDELTPQVQEEKSTDFLQHIELEKSVRLAETETAIIDDLKSRGLDHENDTAKVLVRNLAVTQVHLEHEISYGTIYGSQIRLLKALNLVSGNGQSESWVAEYFAVAQEHIKEFEEWSLENYLNFLFQSSLIIIKDSRYHITTKGQDFVIWLVKNQKNENKPF